MISDNGTRSLPETEISEAYEIIEKQPREVFFDMMNYLASNEALSRHYQGKISYLEDKMNEIVDELEVVTKTYKTRIKMLENRDTYFHSRIKNLERAKLRKGK